MTEFQKKRLAYFIKAARNHDWVRLGPGDVEILVEAEVNEHNFVAADKWQEMAIKQQEFGMEKEAEVIELKEKIQELEKKLEDARYELSDLQDSQDL